MNKIGVTWVSPCCGRRLGINSVDEIVIIDPSTAEVESEWQTWMTNAMCCADLGNGLYTSRAVAEADLDRIKEITVLASIRWSWEKLHQQHDREMEEMRDAVEDFKYVNMYKIDSAGPQPHEGTAGYNEACGYWE